MKRSALALFLFTCLAALPAMAETKPSPAASAPKKSVPFIEDDYQKAFAEARAKKLPVFIEAWAPW